MENKVALVLGGTAAHAELIRCLHKRGYYCVLIDYLDNPPAKNVADEHLKISTLDKEAVLNAAKAMKADLVISGCVDQANISACFAMQQLGLKTPYTYETALNITNKGYMKKVMKENGIPTSDYIYIEGKYDIDAINVNYPVMVKPADSNSSNSVKKADNQHEMQQYLDEAIATSRNGRAIIEEFLTGTEINAYFYILKGEAHLIATTERLSVVEGEERVIKSYTTISPARISLEAERKAVEVANKIAKAFCLENTPMFFQGMVNGADIEVIEFAPRVGGGSGWKIIEQMTGFNMIEAVIDSYIGTSPDLSCVRTPDKYYLVNTMYGEDCIFEKLVGYEKLIEEQVIESVIFYKTKGSVLFHDSASHSRIGSFLTTATDKREMCWKAIEAYSRLNAYDDMGKQVLRKDLNIYDQLFKHTGGGYRSFACSVIEFYRVGLLKKNSSLRRAA